MIKLLRSGFDFKPDETSQMFGEALKSLVLDDNLSQNTSAFPWWLHIKPAKAQISSCS